MFFNAHEEEVCENKRRKLARQFSDLECDHSDNSSDEIEDIDDDESLVDFDLCLFDLCLLCHHFEYLISCDICYKIYIILLAIYFHCFNTIKNLVIVPCNFHVQKLFLQSK